MKHIATMLSPRLEVRDLRVVLALAEAGTTARAAVTLHLTQPAVSRALLALEDKLETSLFERSARGLTLTAAGARLVAEAGPLLIALCELERVVRAPASPPTRLRIVCECYTAYRWLPSALAVLNKTVPGLDLELCIEHTDDPIGALESHEIDAALLTSGIASHESLEEAPLFSDEVVFVMASTHPLASHPSLTRADLRSARLLSTSAPPAEMKWFMQKAFGRQRVKLDVQRLPLTEAIIDVARAGMGVAILSEWITSPHLGHGDLVVKRLSTGALHRPWRLAWRKDIRSAARRLHGALRTTAPRALLAG
ncbi:MAG: metR [Myxococcaceae bacterium]|nr:metR [Myxococcaceae bacterium]